MFNKIKRQMKSMYCTKQLEDNKK
ncbi:hypothetical protein LSH36_131g00012 [Paralvinella palmiformis]|uniref:Uncharacterized protein n=1 Tax=Paralvinella palmiformis TaxID=53620 RepID=A0AAD9JW32_9ANNE|nr:hypothetical protein LSH36_131g00012 [Paralvinella palmiformis]